MLAFAVPPCPRAAVLVPVLWCFVGVQAAFLLGVPQDLGLLVAVAVGIFLLARASVPHDRSTSRSGAGVASR